MVRPSCVVTTPVISAGADGRSAKSSSSSSALFNLARKIRTVLPLQLGVQSKSERGYGLAQSPELRAVKAEPILLTTEMTSAKALQAIAHSCLRQFRLNEVVLTDRDDADALHQTRVALRRLRAAFDHLQTNAG
jgi:inorganic triphosphatase YgiF